MKAVIKHGKPEYLKVKTYKLECPNCFCIFTCSYGDFEWSERSIDGQSAVRCPDCNYEIVFKPSNHSFHSDNKGLLIERYFVKEETNPMAEYPWVVGEIIADHNTFIVVKQCKTQAEAEAKLKELKAEVY